MLEDSSPIVTFGCGMPGSGNLEDASQISNSSRERERERERESELGSQREREVERDRGVRQLAQSSKPSALGAEQQRVARVDRAGGGGGVGGEGGGGRAVARTPSNESQRTERQRKSPSISAASDRFFRAPSASGE
jgi:hypothetical protein